MAFKASATLETSKSQEAPKSSPNLPCKFTLIIFLT